MPKKSLYISDDIDSGVIAAGEGESYSGRVAFLITLGSKAALDAAPGMTVGEWCAVADALNGHWSSYEQGVEGVLKSAWHSVFDSGPECDGKWNVDCGALARKLAALPVVAQAGVYEIARLFWRRGDEVSKCADYAEVFKMLGAKIVEQRNWNEITKTVTMTEEEHAAFQRFLGEIRRGG